MGGQRERNKYPNCYWPSKSVYLALFPPSLKSFQVSWMSGIVESQQTAIAQPRMGYSLG